MSAGQESGCAQSFQKLKRPLRDNLEITAGRFPQDEALPSSKRSRHDEVDLGPEQQDFSPSFQAATYFAQETWTLPIPQNFENSSFSNGSPMNIYSDYTNCQSPAISLTSVSQPPNLRNDVPNMGNQLKLAAECSTNMDYCLDEEPVISGNEEADKLPWYSQSVDFTSNCDSHISEALPDIPTVTEGSSDPEYDVCFGMINTDTTIKLEDDGKDIDFVAKTKYRLAMNGGMVTVHDQLSVKYVCLLDIGTAAALRHLVQKCSVVFEGSAIKQDSEEVKARQGEKRRYKLSLLVYGFSCDSNMVGELLADDGIYLQHPRWNNHAITYSNPQYFCVPSTVLEIPDFQISDDSSISTRTNMAVQRANARSLAVFDSASGPTSFLGVEISKRLKVELLDHQKKALAMMLEKEKGVFENNEFGNMWNRESLKDGTMLYRNIVTGQTKHQIPDRCLGGLLADDMGLGKTISVLALIAGSLDLQDIPPNDMIGTGRDHPTTLLVTPLSTIINWEKQIAEHLEIDALKVLVYHASGKKDKVDFSSYDLVITTYGTLTTHQIKDRKAKRHLATCSLKARHRWCLTGTPIQNQVDDFGALLSFLRIYPFNDRATFSAHITGPLEKGLEVGMQNLRLLINATTLRRTKASLCVELQSKGRLDFTETPKFSPDEQELYDFFKANCYRSVDTMFQAYGTSNSTGSILKVIMRLRQISNHGRTLLPRQAIKAFKTFKDSKTISIQDSEVCDRCGMEITYQESDWQSSFFESCGHFLCKTCILRFQKIADTATTTCPMCEDQAFFSTERFQDVDDHEPYVPSSKVAALLRNLKSFREEPDGGSIKSVIFTSWVKMIDLIEKALSAENIGFVRIDGSKSNLQRKSSLQTFETDANCSVLLATISSAGVGLNLTAASRVHIMEPQWNPMAEEQALDRVCRIGQTREVETFRYIIKDSIDEYIVALQESKRDVIRQSFAETNQGQQNLKSGLQKLKEFLAK